MFTIEVVRFWCHLSLSLTLSYLVVLGVYIFQF